MLTNDGRAIVVSTPRAAEPARHALRIARRRQCTPRARAHESATHHASRAFATQGILKGYDSGVSIVLADATERVFSPTEGVENVVLGLYIVRGDTM